MVETPLDGAKINGASIVLLPDVISLRIAAALAVVVPLDPVVLIPLRVSVSVVVLVISYPDGVVPEKKSPAMIVEALSFGCVLAAVVTARHHSIPGQFRPNLRRH
jgi:hypothetical protein